MKLSTYRKLRGNRMRDCVKRDSSKMSLPSVESFNKSKLCKRIRRFEARSIIGERGKWDKPDGLLTFSFATKSLVMKKIFKNQKTRIQSRYILVVPHGN